MLSIPFIIFNKYYCKQLIKVCNNNITKNNITICNKYIDNNEFYNYTISISIPFSSDTIYSYRDFSLKATGNDKNVKKNYN